MVENNKIVEKIKLKYILILCNCSILVICFYSVYLNIESLEEEILYSTTFDQNMAYARKLSDITDSILNSSIRLLDYAADELEVNNLFNYSFQQDEVIKRLVLSSNFFNASVIISENGYFINNYPKTLGVIGKKFYSPEHNKISNDNDIHVSKPFVTPAGNYIVSLSRTLTDTNGKYMGYLSTAVYINEENLLNNVLSNNTEHSRMTVISNEGSIIFDQDSVAIGMSIENRNLDVTDFSHENGSFIYFDENDAGWYLSYRKNSMGWIIVVETPTKNNEERLSYLMALIGENIIFSLFWGAVSIYVIAYFLTRPLERISMILESGGSHQSLLNVFTWYKESERIRTSLIKNIVSYNDKIEKLDDFSKIDPLTRVYNRRYFNDFTSYIQKKRINASILFIDLDDFKIVNDTHGHEAGDTSLIETTKIIQSSVRDEDRVFRYGGEEFVVVLPETTLKDANVMANRLIEKVAKNIVDGVGVLTISIGLSEFSVSNENTFDIALRQADNALIYAKKTGKNKCVVFNECM